MGIQQQPNVNWNVADGLGKLYGKECAWDPAILAVLMDIRRELQALNNLLACPNFLAIPRTLSAIRVNTRRPKRKRRVTS